MIANLALEYANLVDKVSNLTDTGSTTWLVMFINSIVPTGPTTNSFPPYRVSRSGAWVTFADYLRVDAHRAADHSEREFLNGFRCVSGLNYFPHTGEPLT